MWMIYMHTCPNGKKYIGRTSKNLKTRCGSNGNRYKVNKSFYKDILSYGWDSFSHEILATCETEEESMSLEISFIAKYKTTDPEKGYNKSVGGYPCNKGYTEEDRNRKKKESRIKWESEHPDKVKELHRKFDKSQKRHDWANSWNKTPSRKQKRTEYMRKYRAEHRELLREQARKRYARKKVLSVDTA